WLRQGTDQGQTVIRAMRANLDGTELSDVSFITFDPDGVPARRIEAARAILDTGAWHLTDAKIWPLSGISNPEVDARSHAEFKIASSLTPDEIRDSFGTPASIPIWELPGF